MFVGRKNELRMLNDAYRSGKDELVPVRPALRNVTHR